MWSTHFPSDFLIMANDDATLIQYYSPLRYVFLQYSLKSCSTQSCLWQKDDFKIIHRDRDRVQQNSWLVFIKRLDSIELFKHLSSSTIILNGAEWFFDWIFDFIFLLNSIHSSLKREKWKKKVFKKSRIAARVVVERVSQVGNPPRWNICLIDRNWF